MRTTSIVLAVTLFPLFAVAGEFSLDLFLEKYAVYIGLALLVLEYLLGKTDLVKPNSLLALVLDPLLDFLKGLLNKK